MNAIEPAGGPLTRADALWLTSEARMLLAAFADQTDEVVATILATRDRNAHAVLGYVSWPAYVAAEFADTAAGFGREARSAFAGALAELGMSTRAIAAVTGTSKATAARDVVAGQVSHDETPEMLPLDIPGLDSTSAGRTPAGASGRTRDTPGPHEARVTSEPRRHGLDGKSYPARPRPTMREAEEFGETVPPPNVPPHLTERYARAVERVRQVLGTLDKIAAEDESGAVRHADHENSDRLTEYAGRLAGIARRDITEYPPGVAGLGGSKP